MQTAIQRAPEPFGWPPSGVTPGRPPDELTRWPSCALRRASGVLGTVTLSPSARLGAACWMLAFPLFLLANVIVGLGWRHPGYSWRADNISDLGNVRCGLWDTTRPRYVCSPWHPWMNGALVLTGLLVVIGMLLTGTALGRGRLLRTAQVLVGLGAAGLALAGIFPADVNENNHVLGALLLFGFGNLGLLLIAPALRGRGPEPIRVISLAAGLTALIGTVLFAAQVGPLIGVGGMERLAVFPLPLWATATGLALARLSGERGGTSRP